MLTLSMSPMNYYRAKMKYIFNYRTKTIPFPHQLEAIEYIINHNSIALFDEQGLGKTKMVIDALCVNMEQGTLDGALIICKKHLIGNWKEEIETHSYLKYIVLQGSKSSRGLNFMGYAQFYIINYESVISEVKRLSMFLKIRKMAIVLDESHKIKNPYSKTAKSVFTIKDMSIKRIIITGTPIANKPIDLWSQFYFLDNGMLLGNNFEEFKQKYSIDLREIGIRNDKNRFIELKDKILSNSIRRLKDNVLELPEKVYINKYVYIKEKQKVTYEKLKNELYIEIVNIKGEKIIDESSNILKKLLRLAQIASNPFLIDKSYNETPAKYPILDKLVSEIVEKNEKVIIWSSFVDNIRILRKRYLKYGVLTLYGKVLIERRDEIIKLFKKDSDIKVLIANPSVAKEGLTLTSANNAIYLDRNFNLVDYLQSQDRIHRISQTKTCNIYKIIAKHTIDEYVDDIIYKKQKLAGFVQGDSTDIEINVSLTKEEIINILGASYES